MNFTIRSHTKEALDNLSLSGPRLKNTLSSLQCINSIFGNHRQMTKAILEYCSELPKKTAFHIVDLGCGGGDLIHYISKKLDSKGIDTTFLGIDGNPETIKIATSKNKSSNTTTFLVADILDPNFKIPPCDIVISSHFIYHFEEEALIRFFNTIRKGHNLQIIISELYRSIWAYWLFNIFKEVLPISRIAKKDGLLAIKRAYTIKEFSELLQKSNFSTYTIEKKPWFRSLTKISYHVSTTNP